MTDRWCRELFLAFQLGPDRRHILGANDPLALQFSEATGNAIRVPTPNVSLAVMQLRLSKETTVEELNEHLRRESLDGEQQLQVEFSVSPDAVSSDFVGYEHAAIVDGPATIVTGRQAVVYVWYDNEYGYSRQVLRLVERVSGVRPPTFPR